MTAIKTGLALTGAIMVGFSGVAYAAAESAASAGALDEIVVTAQKRSEKLQDVPISIEVLNGDALASQKLQKLDDLAGRMPNVYVAGGTITNSLTIRGVGSGNNVGFEQSVATFEDGVYHGRAKYSSGSFVDVESLEVLRGPQSIYFGNNAIGGAFNVTTKKPGKEWEGQVSQSYEFNARESVTELASGGPLTDTLGLRVAGHFSNMDGWLTNLVDNQRVPSDRNNFARATLVWDAAPQWQVSLKGEFGHETGNTPYPTQNTHCPPDAIYPVSTPTAGGWKDQLCGAALGFNATFPGSHGSPSAGSDKVYAIAGQRLDLTSHDVVLNIEHKTDDGPSFVALLANTHYNSYSSGAPGSIDIPWFQYSDFETYDQKSVEFRLTSPDSSKVKWIVGLYGMNDTLNVHTPIVFSFLTPTINFLETVPAEFGGLPPGLLSQYTPLGVNVALDQKEKAYSAFGSVTVPLTDKLSGSVGARWTRSDKDGTQYTYNERAGDTFNTFGTPVEGTLIPVPVPVPGVGIVQIPLPLYQILAQAFTTYENHTISQKVNGQAFLPSANLTYKWTDDVSSYVSYSRGWKAGGFDGSDTVADPTKLAYNPETVNSYELGFKSLLLDHTLSINVALFDSKYAGLQQGVTVATDTSVVVHTINVGNLESRGMEFDADWRINSIWRAGLNAAYLDAKYSNYDNAGCTQAQTLAAAGDPCVQSLSGKAPPFAPKYSGSAYVGFGIPFVSSTVLSGEVRSSFSDKYDLLGVNDPEGYQASWNKIDLRLGLGGGNGKWDVSALVKNINNVQTVHGVNPAVYGIGSYTVMPDRGRQFALQFVMKL